MNLVDGVRDSCIAVALIEVIWIHLRIDKVEKKINNLPGAEAIKKFTEQIDLSPEEIAALREKAKKNPIGGV